MASGIQQPVIKWSGSKRSVARMLKKLWPEHSPEARYFEPFVGGGSMLTVRPVPAGIAGDTVVELVDLWVALRDHPERVISHYSELWHRRQSEGHMVFYEVRERFNKERGALDLLFLSRMCVNGLIRFNSKGDFNNSLHHTRPGVHPDRLASVVRAWAEVLSGVDFMAADYRTTLASAKAGDLVFLDPPYVGTKGRYHPTPFDFKGLYQELERLNSVGAHWMLTLDGHAGERTYQDGIPEDLYRSRLSIPTGNSPFTRLMSTSLDSVVESVYLNFEPPAKVLSGSVQQGHQPLRSRTEENVETDALLA